MNTVWAHEIGNRQKWRSALPHEKIKKSYRQVHLTVWQSCLWYIVWIYNTSEALNAWESDYCMIFPLLFESLIYNSLLNSVFFLFFVRNFANPLISYDWFFRHLTADENVQEGRDLISMIFFSFDFLFSVQIFWLSYPFFLHFQCSREYHLFFFCSFCMQNAAHLQFNWLLVALINWH